MRMRTLAFVFAVALGACAGGGGDDPPPTPDAPQQNIPTCGDGTCAGAEVGVCPQDCGGTVATCGNTMCDAGETPQSCPNDCMTQTAMCGNGQCEMNLGENSTNCPGDCGGQQGGTCPTDPTACLFCAFDPGMCTGGLTPEICLECIAGGL